MSAPTIAVMTKAARILTNVEDPVRLSPAMQARETDPVQAAVEDLAGALGLPVLVEDPYFRPLWWSTHGVVDDVRTSSIMQRTVSPAARAIPKRFKLYSATVPIRTPAVPEAGMLPRWCVPIRREDRLVGFLWVIDPDGRVREEQLPLLTACAALAARSIANQRDQADFALARRAELLAELLADSSEESARELTLLESLPERSVVGVDEGAPTRGRWALTAGFSAHVNPPAGHSCTGGQALPLTQLSTALHRARQTRRALQAGAQLAAPTWNALGAWRLLVEAPSTLMPPDLQEAVTALSDPRNAELRGSVRLLLELGGDVAETARQLHLHRTTLYYRLERVAEICRIDLKDARVREDLLAALRLQQLRDLS